MAVTWIDAKAGRLSMNGSPEALAAALRGQEITTPDGVTRRPGFTPPVKKRRGPPAPPGMTRTKSGILVPG